MWILKKNLEVKDAISITNNIKNDIKNNIKNVDFSNILNSNLFILSKFTSLIVTVIK